MILAGESVGLRSVFDGIRDGDVPYQRLSVTSNVLAELATAQIRPDLAMARTAIDVLQKSEIVSIVHPGAEIYDAARHAFVGRDSAITLTTSPRPRSGSGTSTPSSRSTWMSEVSASLFVPGHASERREH